MDSINDFDFVFLSETWTNELNVLDLEGFDQPVCKHRKRRKGAKRDSGGLCTYFRKEISKGVEEIFLEF